MQILIFACDPVENSPLVLINEALAPALQAAIPTFDRRPPRLINGFFVLPEGRHRPCTSLDLLQ